MTTIEQDADARPGVAPEDAGQPRPWFRKPQIMVPVALLVVLSAAFAASGGTSGDRAAVDVDRRAAAPAAASAPVPVDTPTAVDATASVPVTAPAPAAVPAAVPAPLAGPPSSDPSESVSQRNARLSAATYLSHAAFSRTGLIDQLEYEGFSAGDATYGVDAQDADWNEQAAKTAASYLRHSAFSRAGLIGQLIYEGYTPAQAEYGVGTTGL